MLHRRAARALFVCASLVLLAAPACVASESDTSSTSGGSGGGGGSTSSTAETTAAGGATTATGGGGAGGAGGEGGGPIINQGFIGGPCLADADCSYPGAFCLPEAEGFPGGMCSLDCDLYCPDQAGAVGTFCLDPGDLGTTSAAGLCTVRCDYGQSPTGCRDGYQCKPLPRHTDPSAVVYSCVPGTDDPFQLGACHEELLARGIGFAPAQNPLDHPDGLPELVCDIEDPVWITPLLRGITYRPDSLDNDPAPLFVACPMALAMDDASKMLADRGGTDLVHLGTYNCRVIAGTMTLSEHGLARALDIAAIRIQDGSVYTVLADWEMNQPNPVTEAGAFLGELVQSYHDQKVFNVILTPDYNAAHADHFHCDLTPGSDFLQ